MKRAWISGLFLLAACSLANAGVQWQTISNVKAGKYSANTKYPKFTGPGPVSAMASTLYANEEKRQHAAFLSSAVRSLKSQPKPVAAYEFDQTATVTLYNPNLVSGYVERYDYSGGAHPNTFYVPINVGLVNGKARRLRLADVLLNSTPPVDVLEKVVLPALNAIKKQQGVEKIDTIDGDLADNFVVTAAGLTWVFQPYAVGPYSDGEYFVKIPYSKLKGMIDPKGPLGSLLK